MPPQPDETPSGLQHVFPLQVPEQHSPAQLHEPPLPVQAGALQVPPPPHTCGQEQLPQLMPERCVPQLSLPELVPQFLPRRVQKALFVSGVHTQVLVVQVSAGGVVQAPQLVTVRGAPQASVPVKVPQAEPRRVQKAVSVSMQPHRLATPPPAQLSGVVQVPQLDAVRGVPQLSVPVKAPHCFPRRAQKTGSVSGVQVQALLVQVRAGGVVQAPQSAVRALLQLSVPLNMPHAFPWRVQNVASLSAMQEQTPAVLQVFGVEQGPQLATVRAVPQASLAVCAPQVRPRRAQKA